MSIKAAPAGIARTGTFLEGKPYRRFGNPDWDPAAGLSEPAAPGRGLHPAHEALRARQKAAAEARQRKFAAHRSEGLSVAEAAGLIGISVKTARRYEAERKRAGGAA
jgi:DNA-directed RNA polymerase specialized sigma24 family protein